MKSRFTHLNMASLLLGLVFLYLPIAILVGYSFNASRLVTVWAASRPNGTPASGGTAL